MIRKIVKIDTEKCNGCGACAQACLEEAIGIIDGKAVLLRDDYCDGLGNCLPVCPMDAISFEEREAAAFDEEAVKRNQAQKKQAVGASCAGAQTRSFFRANAAVTAGKYSSELRQWPVQIKLAPLAAPYFNQADMLIAADCSAFAYGNFHAEFIRGHITLIGCPKLDGVDYAEKLVAIFSQNLIKSLLVVRMEVPCCGGLQKAVQTARDQSGKQIPVRVVTISTYGKIVGENVL